MGSDEESKESKGGGRLAGWYWSGTPSATYISHRCTMYIKPVVRVRNRLSRLYRESNIKTSILTGQSREVFWSFLFYFYFFIVCVYVCVVDAHSPTAVLLEVRSWSWVPTEVGRHLNKHLTDYDLQMPILCRYCADVQMCDACIVCI